MLSCECLVVKEPKKEIDKKKKIKHCASRKLSRATHCKQRSGRIIRRFLQEYSESNEPLNDNKNVEGRI